MSDDVKKPGDFALLIGKRLAGKKGDVMDDDAGPSEEAPKEDDKKSQMLSSAFSSISAAIKTGNAEAGKEALRQFIEMCDDDGPSEEAPSDDIGPPPEGE